MFIFTCLQSVRRAKKIGADRLLCNGYKYHSIIQGPEVSYQNIDPVSGSESLILNIQVSCIVFTQRFKTQVASKQELAISGVRMTSSLIAHASLHVNLLYPNIKKKLKNRVVVNIDDD